MTPRHRAWSLVTAATVALTACHRPPPPPAPALGLRCANASVVWDGDPHPARVEVENRTDKEMRIVIDRCLHHTLLGTVGPGGKAYLALPRRLVRFGDGLRLHAYTQEPNQWYGSFRADLAVPLAHVTISPETAIVDAPPSRSCPA